LPSAWGRRICCGLDEAGPYTFVAADALVLKVREAGRVVNVHALIAVGVNAEGFREISASTSAPPKTERAGSPSGAR
jgi:hypothetical protein